MKGMKNSDREFCKRICSARISEEQKEILEQFMEEHGISESDAIRFAINLLKGKSTKFRITEKVEVDL